MENEQQQEPALTHARQLARHTGATVILAWLVPVVASGEQFFTQVQVEPGSSGARRIEQGEAYLSQAVQGFRADGVDVESRVARAQEIDLIVMATLPQSAVGRFLFGSVGEKVRRRSSVPVLFASPAEIEKGGV
jgi:nucleotide-binding universal stress UspA family protein